MEAFNSISLDCRLRLPFVLSKVFAVECRRVVGNGARQTPIRLLHVPKSRRAFQRTEVINPSRISDKHETHWQSAASPDRLGPRFGVLVGSYVAALVAPTLTLFAVEYFGLSSKVLGFAVLGTIGVAVGSGAALLTADDERIASWLHSGWMAWLFPLAGLAPMVAYGFDVLEALALYLVESAAVPVSTLVGATGFLLGIVAAGTGEIAVRTARNRVASSAVASESVLIEWTAKWPRAHRVAVQALTLVTGLVPVGILSLSYPPHVPMLAGTIVVALLIVTNTVLSDRSYKLTPAGVERRRSGSGSLITWHQFIPKEQIEDVAVSENHVTLRRSGLLPSVRFSRRDSRLDDEEIVDSLEEHLDSRE